MASHYHAFGRTDDDKWVCVWTHCRLVVDKLPAGEWVAV